MTKSFPKSLAAAAVAAALALCASPAWAQDGEGDYSSLAVDGAGAGVNKPSTQLVKTAKRKSVEVFALPFKLFDGNALGTGLSLELAIPGWSGIRVGATGHRSLSQNNQFYLTDLYFGAYGKFFFHSALHGYGISPFASVGLGFYRVDAEAIDRRRASDRTMDSTSLALSGGVHYQYNKRFAGYGEYQVHSGEGSLNTLQLGLNVWLF